LRAYVPVVTVRVLVCSLLVLAVGGCAASQSESTVQRANPEPESRDLTPSDTMWHHFIDVAKARDAVIAGKLEAVRPPMRRIAAGDYGASVRPEWNYGLHKMQQEAARAAQAPDLAQASQAVAAVTGHCGACHRTLGGGPNMQGQPEGYEPYGHEGVSAAMDKLVWAADEMWLGITIPHDPAWVRGAEALVSAQSAVASDEPSAEPSAKDAEIDRAIEELRAVGERAAKVTAPSEMQTLYGELIARCGTCHSAMQVPVSPKLAR
jgi:mono/diheme cytochrome c family protein